MGQPKKMLMNGNNFLTNSEMQRVNKKKAGQTQNCTKVQQKYSRLLKANSQVVHSKILL